MPGLKTFLSAYLCTFRTCAKDKNLGRNFKTIRQTDRLTNILTTVLACQDFCKWHFTQLCQGYKHFCLLTYAHSEFVPKTKTLEETSRRSDEQTNRQTNRLTNILTTNFACQDFCKWHFTQLCQGYRHFCLLTYAHSGFVPKTKPWRKKCRIKTIRQIDKLTGQRQNLGEKKNLKTIRRKAWKKLQVKMNRRTDKVTHICKCFPAWHEKKWCC